MRAPVLLVAEGGAIGARSALMAFMNADPIGVATLDPSLGGGNLASSWGTFMVPAAIAKGVEMIQDEVTGVAREGGRITGVILASGGSLSCGMLVNAAGTGAGQLAAMAGIDLPVGPRKRYVYVLDCPQASEALHRAPLTVDPLGCYFRPEGRHFICGLSPKFAFDSIQR